MGPKLTEWNLRLLVAGHRAKRRVVRLARRAVGRGDMRRDPLGSWILAAFAGTLGIVLMVLLLLGFQRPAPAVAHIPSPRSSAGEETDEPESTEAPPVVEPVELSQSTGENPYEAIPDPFAQPAVAGRPALDLEIRQRPWKPSEEEIRLIQQELFTAVAESTLGPLAATEFSFAPDALNGWMLFDADQAIAAVEPALYEAPPHASEPSSRDETDPDSAGELETSREINVSIERIAPARASVYELTSYSIVVRNESESAVDQVLVEEVVPSGCRIVSVSPPAAMEGQRLAWRFGRLEAAAERILTIELYPTRAGTADGMAAASFASPVAATTSVVAPRLKLETIATNRILRGTAAPIRFRVTNTGEIATPGVLLLVDLPEQLNYRQGRLLEYDVPSLGPGEAHEARLTATAESVGPARVQAELVVSSSSRERTAVELQVVEGSTQPLRPGALLPCCPEWR